MRSRCYVAQVKARARRRWSGLSAYRCQAGCRRSVTTEPAAPEPVHEHHAADLNSIQYRWSPNAHRSRAEFDTETSPAAKRTA